MRILIAEDDVTSRSILTALLEKCGHEVVETVNGMDAWNILRQPGAPKMAILDWMMPQLDGVEVCRRVRALESDQPPYIIVLTAKNDKASIIAGLDAGADDFLAKPYDPGELQARIKVGQRIIDLQSRLAGRMAELQNALDDVRTLRGIIPICPSCKKVRNDEGYWKQVEAYVRDHTEAEFSHVICPPCMKELYPEYVDD
ncbi:MAG: response regulator transcription factor [Candidatus Hydrogenedentales bacterium]|jgi:DNA-binding response OmpR family regulator